MTSTRFYGITDFEPRKSFVCEHPDHPERECLTLRTESGERFCVDHYPWASHAEAERVQGQLRTLGL